MSKPLTRQQRWRRENPRRYLAHLYVEAAKRMGILAPQPCEMCGAIYHSIGGKRRRPTSPPTSSTTLRGVMIQ